MLEPITRFCAYFPDINECASDLLSAEAFSATWRLLHH